MSSGQGCVYAGRGVRVTIGIPFFNASNTLRAAIQSVLAQTFTDWELILVNDGSTDSSRSIASEISDSRITLVSLTTNRGLVWGLNEIARRASGEYLARMDADDLMHPRRIERQVQFLDQHPDIQMLSTAAYVIDADGLPVGMRALRPPDTRPSALLRRNLIVHPSVMGRTAWFRENPYDPDYPRSEDHELWCRTCQKTAWGHLPEPLLFLRDCASAQVAKYAASCRSDRRIYRSYGPTQVGRVRTAMLLMGGFAKPLIYSAMVRLGLEAELLRGRNLPISPDQAQEASEIIRFRGRTAEADQR